MRFTQNNEDADFVSPRSTVGVDLKVKIVCIRDKTLKVSIWDTAGQERFRTLTSAYYRGAQGIILVYDITDRDSFENITHWLKEIDLYSSDEEVVKFLIGNKMDNQENRVISKVEALNFARENNMLFLETSAKTREGVHQAFEELLQKILDSPSIVGQELGYNGYVKNSTDSNKMRLDRNFDDNQPRGFCG
jgi:Ras-related protein Rab-18